MNQQERERAAVMDLSLWKVYLYGGPGFSPSVTTKLYYNNALLVSATDNGKVSGVGPIGLEFEHHAPPAIAGFSVLMERLNYVDTEGDSTSILNIVGMPKIFRQYDRMTLWVGLGFGFTSLNLGGSSTIVQNGVRYSIDPSAVGYVVVPRVGLTYDFGKFFVGAHLGRTIGAASTDASAIDLSTGQTFNFDYHISGAWWDSAIRFGFSL